MIPEYAITEWRQTVPWVNAEQVEQDLIICKALTEIYRNEYLASQLAFRGGTALHKLYIAPQSRYSEDIDLVQLTPLPIKSLIDTLRDVLYFLGEPVVKQKKNNNTLIYKFKSEIPPILPLRLKVEINCREHFSVLGLNKINFSVKNQWFSGNAEITTYKLEELLGTKFRALYQRRKGRDLFDIYNAVKGQNLNIEKIFECYRAYMKFSVENPPSKMEFIRNLDEKIYDSEFISDTDLLLRLEDKYNVMKAYEYVRNLIMEFL